jgi:hypothetical protein
MRRVNGQGRCEALADAVNVTLEPGQGTTKRATADRGLFEVVTDGQQVSLRRPIAPSAGGHLKHDRNY